MARTLEMFDKPRKKREWLMHVDDCGDGNCGVLDKGDTFVKMKCHRCGHETEWMGMPIKEAKHGIPCPKCNAVSDEKITNGRTMKYAEMNKQQRAQYLLDKGVVAQLDIDPKKLEPAYLASVPGIGTLPCGYHDTEESAIQTGTNWLRAIATTPAA